jgi:hypothetical protein
MDRLPVPSVSIKDQPQWAVVTNGGDYGYGVFSWHVVEQDAKHNASITGGKLVPVDYLHGELIIPSLAKRIIEKKIKSMLGDSVITDEDRKFLEDDND